VADLTSAQLAHIDVGSWFNAAHPELADDAFVDQRVPTLREVLKTISLPEGPIYIELKSETPDVEALCAAVAIEIRESNLLPQIIVKSFRLGAIPMMRLLCPDVQTAALFAPNIRNLLARKKHLLTIAREMGADQLSLHYTLATKKISTLAAQAKMPITVWTVDDPRWIEKCKKRRIRSLITNDPARFLAMEEIEEF
jgi:glycerophosphoryl diester phosphodiesterase